ncbi:MAG: SapC family protein [Proteobacteria bacterium]|nr:SapC family protein [Pseudomonadota bacterium]
MKPPHKEKNMSEDQQNTDNNLTLLFYRQITVLNPQRHGDLKLGSATDQSFASHTNSVPLVGVEFSESCHEYPIIFSRAENNTYSPVAVLGMENAENLFLDEGQLWKSGYVPAFVRRYPFVLGENPENLEKPWVCVDESCPWLGKEQGEPLFIGDQPSTFLKQTLTFLTDYNLQSQRTVAFCGKLVEWGLLKEHQAQATTADGKAYTLTGLWAVDEAALTQLEDAKIQELFKTGGLAWIYFHLASLGNFRRLAERKAAKAPAVALH